MSLYLSRQGIISGAAVGPESLLTGLVAWWPMDETSGTRYDAHTNGYHLTEYNSIDSIAGKQGNAAHLIKENLEYLNIDGQIYDHTIDHTFALWYQYLSNVGGETYIMGARGSWNWTGLIITGASAAAQIRFTDTYHRTPASSSCLGSLHCVIADYNAATQTLSVEVDRANKKFYVSTLPVNSVAQTGFGFNNTIGTRFNTYYLDEPAVWNRLLSEAERDLYYNSGAGIGYPG